MKIKKGFIMSQVGDTYVVVPVGKEAANRQCLIRLNDTSAFLWKQLQTETTVDALVEGLLAEYDVEEDRARTDAQRFVDRLREADLLDE